MLEHFYPPETEKSPQAEVQRLLTILKNIQPSPGTQLDVAFPGLGHSEYSSKWVLPNDKATIWDLLLVTLQPQPYYQGCSVAQDRTRIQISKGETLRRLGFTRGIIRSFNAGLQGRPNLDHPEGWYSQGNIYFYPEIYAYAEMFAQMHRQVPTQKVKIPYDEYIRTDAYRQEMIRKKLWDHEKNEPKGGFRKASV